jgi:hypothetical protein
MSTTYTNEETPKEPKAQEEERETEEDDDDWGPIKDLEEEEEEGILTLDRINFSDWTSLPAKTMQKEKIKVTDCKAVKEWKEQWQREYQARISKCAETFGKTMATTLEYHLKYHPVVKNVAQFLPTWFPPGSWILELHTNQSKSLTYWQILSHQVTPNESTRNSITIQNVETQETELLAADYSFDYNQLHLTAVENGTYNFYTFDLMSYLAGQYSSLYKLILELVGLDVVRMSNHVFETILAYLAFSICEVSYVDLRLW